jgi:hypothetical protein
MWKRMPDRVFSVQGIGRYRASSLLEIKVKEGKTMSRDSHFSRAEWRAIPEVERNTIIHERIMLGSGIPLRYLAEWDAIHLLLAKLQILYKVHYFFGIGSSGKSNWNARAETQVDSLMWSYYFEAETGPEAICLALLHSMDILRVTDIRELAC